MGADGIGGSYGGLDDGFRGTASDMAAHRARQQSVIQYECFECAAHEKQIADLKAENEKLKLEVRTWKSTNVAMVGKLDDYKKVANQLSKESDELQNLKAKMRMHVSKKIELDYFMLKDGDLPILWVNAWNKDLFPQSSFMQMADRIKRINPDIDLILLTYGVESLQQLDDKDLARIGLFRNLDTPFVTVHSKETALLVVHEQI